MMMQNVMLIASMAKIKFMDFITNEDGDVNIVSIVVLIGVAVLLAMVFKDAIKELIETLLETITNNAKDTVGVPAGGETPPVSE